MGAESGHLQKSWRRSRRGLLGFHTIRFKLAKGVNTTRSGPIGRGVWRAIKKVSFVSANKSLACIHKTLNRDLMQTASLSNCKRLAQALMTTITILGFVLGSLLGLISNVGVLIFAIASLAGLIFALAMKSDFDLTTSLISLLYLYISLCVGYFGGVALRELRNKV
jgi:hypothetical protein